MSSIGQPPTAMGESSTTLHPASAMAQQTSLPPISSLTGDLPFPDNSSLPIRGPNPDPRDSGNWSQSKHSSGVSNSAGIQLHSILNAEDSPSRNSIPETPLSARAAPHIGLPGQRILSSPNAECSVQHHQLPSINQPFDPRASLDANSLLDSRRSSVDSRVNMGMGHLQISPPSPYDSQNVSRASLVSNLQQQRGITDNRPNGTSGPLSPLGQRNGLKPQVAPRQAPVINPNPRSVSGMPDPTAAAPTKGFPWAFPDQDELDDQQRRSSSASSIDQRPSRQNSFATASSIFTVDSALPPGQKRFSEEMPQTHHHSILHRSVSSLQSAEPPGTATGAGSYSRTPELRVSHKMAERKRRSEMKNLFDELNSILPTSAGGKSSKWEVLTKAIDHINTMKKEMNRASAHYQQSERELHQARQLSDETRLLKEEAAAMWQHLRRLEPSNPHVYGAFSNQMAHERSHQAVAAHPAPLPPIQPNAWAPGPSVMQGVEYPHGQPFDRR